MGKRTWIIFIGVVVILFGGLILLSNNSKLNVSKVNPNVIQKASSQSGNIADHVLGKAGSKVVFIEYGDFQCPYCDEAYAPIKSVTTQYEGQIAFVFRNFPLTTLHPNALAAAGAAEAAGLQGKFWQYHDLLYQDQSSWDSLTGDQRTSAFVSYASQLGLNTTKFTADMSSSAVSSKISFDQAIGEKLGIDSTPSFYLDGKPVSSTIEQQIVSGTTTGLTNLLNSELSKYGIAPPAASSTSSS